MIFKNDFQPDDDDEVDSDDQSPTLHKSNPPLKPFSLTNFDNDIFWKKPALYENKSIEETNKPLTTENSQQRVKEIRDYMEFYDNLQDTLIERGEHRTPLQQKARAK